MTTKQDYELGYYVPPNIRLTSKQIELVRPFMEQASFVLTNTPLRKPHHRLCYHNEDNSTLNSNFIFLPKGTKEDSITMMLEIAKRSQKILLILDDPDPLIPIYLTKMRKPYHIIYQNHFVTGNEIKKWIQQEIGLQERYQERENPMILPTRTIATPNGGQLRPYQIQMVNTVKKLKRCGLFVDMGLGKTLATLATINELHQEQKLDSSKPILLIAPLTVALDTWKREVEDWGYDFDVEIFAGLNKKQREKTYPSLLEKKTKPTLITINTAQLKNLQAFLNEHYLSNVFSMIVIDELSMYKSAQTQQFELTQSFVQEAPYVIGLTGTPIPNHYTDLYGQVLTIDPTLRRVFGENQWQFYDRFFFPAKTAWNNPKRVYKYGITKQNVRRMKYYLKAFTLTLESQGRVDLPEVVYQNRYVHMPKKAQKIYTELNTTIRSEIQAQEQKSTKGKIEGVTVTIDGEKHHIANSGVLRLRKLQITSGSLYKSNTDLLQASFDKKMDYQILHDAKFVALKKIIETATSPVLIFYWFQSEWDRMNQLKLGIEKLNPRNKKTFSDTISRWNKGEIPAMAIHPASAAHGLNIQKGGHTIVWLTLPDSNERYRQANKRLHRPGQQYPVTITHLLVPYTEDEEVLRKLTKNENQQQDLLHSLDSHKN